MKQSTIEIMVGVFVALGLAALFMLAMKVSNIAVLNDDSGYEVQVYFENIGGLKVRSPVTVAGVRVGRVTAIDFDDEIYEAVVTLRIGEDYRLPSDSSASILTAGLLGEQYVSFEPGGAETYLKDGDRVTLSQSALVLEKIIGQVLFNKAAEGETK